MVTVAKTNVPVLCFGVVAWVQLVSLPLVVVWLSPAWPPWLFMWVLAFSVYSGLKWFSFADPIDPREMENGSELFYVK